MFSELEAHFALLPQPWWLVVGIYEAVLIGTWLAERALIRHYRDATGDPVGGGSRDRRYIAAWVFWLCALQIPLIRAGNYDGDLPESWLTVGLGLALALAGAAVRLHAISHLQENFSYVVAVTDKHRLVTTGPYRLVRHPAYGGLILFFVGAPLILCDVWSLLGVQIVVGISVSLRIRREERWMREQFGSAFEAWKARTTRLIPRIL